MTLKTYAVRFICILRKSHFIKDHQVFARKVFKLNLGSILNVAKFSHSCMVIITMQEQQEPLPIQ